MVNSQFIKTAPIEAVRALNAKLSKQLFTNLAVGAGFTVAGAIATAGLAAQFEKIGKDNPDTI